jgi:hypothetical protein
MNGPFALEQARLLAEKALATAPVPPVTDALGPGSAAAALAFLADQLAILRPADPVPGREPPAPAAARAEALANLCQQLLACNEFLYVD